mmetsp:Transcript_7599/g.1030  ORF Transcript_7599/g.1030 Transcript_7599/m.1030 type:complete len:86 (-) Transcript_7599:127-384(-)
MYFICNLCIVLVTQDLKRLIKTNNLIILNLIKYMICLMKACKFKCLILKDKKIKIIIIMDKLIVGEMKIMEINKNIKLIIIMMMI